MVRRRVLLRYGFSFLCLLVVCAWYRGWFLLQVPDPPGLTPGGTLTPARGLATRRSLDLPVVYMDRHVKNHTHLLKPRPLIPKIIHQTWVSHSIPSKFVPLARTWLKVNPGYEYWFWTDADAARFIETYYPQSYPLYKSYPQNIMRADAIRYFILYHFGGWYADMDIEALRPLDNFTRSHHCLLSQEPWPHTKMFWNKDRLACNALMAARPGHPFFDLVINELPKASKRAGKNDVMARTGPKFIDSTVTLYEKLYADNYSLNTTVYLADPNAFLPTLAANALSLLKKRCTTKQNDVEKRKICDHLIATNYKNDPPKDAYTNHVWVHTYYGIDQKKNENLFNVVPKAKKAKDILDQMEKEARNMKTSETTKQSHNDKTSKTIGKKLGQGF